MADEAIDCPSIFSKEQIEHINSRVAEAAREVCGDRLRGVVLYGSYARGDYHEWSDVDYMVFVGGVLENEVWQLWESLTDSLSDLDLSMNLLLSVKISLHDDYIQHKNWHPFFRNIDAEGIRI